MLTYGFFNSQNGDRKYNANQMSSYFEGLISDGVYQNVDDACVVRASAGMTVTVGKGRAVIGGKWLKNDALYDVTITGSNPTNPRYSAVVIKLDNNARTITLTSVDGTPATTPTKPTVTNTPNIKYLILAYVLVPAGATSIVQSNIEDARSLSVCGWVSGLIEQVDTATLFLQWQSAYEQQFENFKTAYDEWFDTLTQELNVNTYIKKYHGTITTSEGNRYNIESYIDNYTYQTGDIIQIVINGLVATDTIDYTINYDAIPHALVVTFNFSKDNMVGNIVDITILRSKIGFNS